MVRDRIVCGINNARIQSQLLQERDLTYQNALDTAQAMELAAKDIADMQKDEMFTLPLVVVQSSGPSLLGHNCLQQIKLNWTKIHAYHPKHH